MMIPLKNITADEPKRLIKPIIWMSMANIINLFPFVCLIFIVHTIYKYYAGAAFSESYLWLAWLVMVAFFFITYYFENKSTRIAYRDAYALSADGRIKLAEHFRKLPLGFLMSKDPGELSNTMVDDFAQTERAITHALTQLISGVLVAAFSLLIMSFIDWRLALAMFAGLPVTILILWAAGGLERKLNINLSKAKIEQSNRIQEYLSGMKVIKAYNMRGENFGKLKTACYNFRKECIKSEAVVGPIKLIAAAFLRAGLPITAITGVYLVLGGKLIPHVLAIFLLVCNRIFDPLSAAIMRLSEFKAYDLAGERITGLLHQPIMTGCEEPPEAHGILFENVTFGYGQKNVLENVTTKMDEGTLTAIVGLSGSGKSTMLRLIARFYDPKDGKMLFGGKNESEIEPERLMSKISMVFQDVYLFQDTVGNNIRYGKENATQEEIEAAAKEANCYDFIMKLPEGFDTMIGEGGSTLSGGEKQRISIARAMLKNAPVVLLDEATSSLDPENEEEIQKAIARLIKGRTVVMIAHHLKTVVNADNIVVLNEGRIVEQGKHEELLRKDGLYTTLWNLQEKTISWQIS